MFVSHLQTLLQRISLAQQLLLWRLETVRASQRILQAESEFVHPLHLCVAVIEISARYGLSSMSSKDMLSSLPRLTWLPTTADPWRVACVRVVGHRMLCKLWLQVQVSCSWVRPTAA